MRFSKESLIRASAERIFAFHERKDAFQLLLPPWQKTEIIQPPESLEVGTRVVVRVKIGPLWQTVEAVHTAYEPGRMFEDRMLKGPFRFWNHRHIVLPEDAHSARLLDEIEYELPLGAIGRAFGGGFARRELERLFEYRHAATREACEG